MAEAKKTAKKAEPKEKSVKEEPKEPTTEEKIVAKAGKRSAKAIAEVEEKQAKEVRKTKTSTEAKPKKPVKPPRSRLERRSKKYRESAKLIDKTKQYSLKEALALAVKTSTVKFDASVELHVRLGVDPKASDQNVRDTVVLPAGSGKDVKIAVFTDEDIASLKEAGADIVGSDDLLAQLDKEVLNFDVLITSPQMMARLAKYARILGPRGLMPNPKSGTVAKDLAGAVKQAKSGRVEYRVDSEGIIHLSIGKVSFGDYKLSQNTEAVMASIKAARPSSIKTVYIQSIYVTTTMGPSIPVSY